MVVVKRLRLGQRLTFQSPPGGKRGTVIVETLLCIAEQKEQSTLNEKHLVKSDIDEKDEDTVEVMIILVYGVKLFLPVTFLKYFSPYKISLVKPHRYRSLIDFFKITSSLMK